MPKESYVKVKRFGVDSVARTAAIFGMAIGVIALIVSVAAGLSGLSHRFSVGAGIGVGLVVLIASILVLFIGGAVEAFLYNGIANLVGSVRIVVQKDVLSKVDPLSYAKVSFVFSLIIYGIVAVFVSSILLTAVGLSSTSAAPAAIIAAAFIFALVVYGFILPYISALVYNWLSGKIGGIGIVLKRGLLERIEVWSYVKIVLALSVIVFIIEKAIGAGIGIAVGTPTSGGLAFVGGLVAIIVVGLVVNILVAWFYNIVAKRFGGVAVELVK